MTAVTDHVPPAPGDRGAAGTPLETFQPPESLRPAVDRLFGARLPLAVRYAEFLATDGVVRGLIGPREAPRIWDRHLLNCAALGELIAPGATVIDVGSGAGLPGIVLAVARPDLAITLLEPMERRVTFLVEAVARLELEGVVVRHGRAEESAGSLAPAQVVTARAVAPLDRLAGWCLPLTDVGGRLLAIKGATAAAEIAAHEAAVRRYGGGKLATIQCGVGVVDPPTTVIEVVCERRVRAGHQAAGRRGAVRKNAAREGARGGRKRGRGAK